MHHAHSSNILSPCYKILLNAFIHKVGCYWRWGWRHPHPKAVAFTDFAFVWIACAVSRIFPENKVSLHRLAFLKSHMRSIVDFRTPSRQQSLYTGNFLCNDADHN